VWPCRPNSSATSPGKFPCASPIKGLRLPQDMTETYPQNRRLGYARVSTYGQTLDTQLEQLRGEKVTGAHSDRRELLKMLAALAPGDVVTVTRIDRLARSTFDLFGIVKRIVAAKVQIRSLADPRPLTLRHSRQRPPDAARRALRSTNSPAATIVGISTIRRATRAAWSE